MVDKHNVEAVILPEPGEEEVWKPAPGFEGRYEVSSFGNIRRTKTQRVRKICYDNCGYPAVCIKINSKVHFIYIHRLVCEAFNGSPTEEFHICDHIDRCIVNNYYKNLRWTDHRGNGLNRKTGVKRKMTLDSTPIIFFSLDDDPIQRFDSIKQASQELGLSLGQIQHNIRGYRRPFKNGYFRVEADVLTE